MGVNYNYLYAHLSLLKTVATPIPNPPIASGVPRHTLYICKDGLNKSSLQIMIISTLIPFTISRQTLR